MKHAPSPCDFINISKVIGYGVKIGRMLVALQNLRPQVFVKIRTHQSRSFCEQYEDPIPVAEVPIGEQSRCPRSVSFGDRKTRLSHAEGQLKSRKRSRGVKSDWLCNTCKRMQSECSLKSQRKRTIIQKSGSSKEPIVNK